MLKDFSENLASVSFIFEGKKIYIYKEGKVGTKIGNKMVAVTDLPNRIETTSGCFLFALVHDCFYNFKYKNIVQ